MRPSGWDVIFAIVLFLFSSALAEAASYYVSPNGSGSSCSTASPCSLNGGLNKAHAGDELVLMNGVYRQRMDTVRSGTVGNPILIRAENRHQATIRPFEGGNSNREEVVRIRHSNISMRWLRSDGSNNGLTGVRVGNNVSNVIVEDNIIENTSGGLVGVFAADNVIFRHNIIQWSGRDPSKFGECFYIAAAGQGEGGLPVDNLEIYGNTVRGCTANAIDHKPDAKRVHTHHNIFEDSEKLGGGRGGDGFIRAVGDRPSVGAVFENNIIRNIANFSLIRLDGHRVDIRNNVFYNADTGKLFPEDKTTGGSRMTSNTFCKTQDSPIPGDLVQSNNRFNAPQSACDAEVQRILNEMKSLPGVGAGMTSDDPPTSLPGVTCHTIQSPKTVPAGFGVPYSAITSTHELLIAAGCQGNNINVSVGNAQSPLLVYVWPTIHYWVANARKTTQLTCAEQVSGWCRKEGSATITVDQNETWVIGYACQWDGSRWWCGCRTSQCAPANATGSLWQAQKILRP